MSKKRLDRIKKIAQTSSSVQPLYETASGEEITATAIVQGKVKPPKIWPAGSYKPKSIYKRKRGFGGKNKKSDVRRSGLRKTSYRSDIAREVPPVRNMPVINLPKSSEPFFGYIPNDFTGSGDRENLEEFFWNANDDNFISNDNDDGNTFNLVNYLVDLSDNFDKSGKHFFSNFTDFIIKKASEADGIDFSEYFNEFILKLNSSDLDIKTEYIKKFAKKFSELVNLNIKNGESVGVAKENAYKKIIVIFKENIGSLDA